MPTSDYLEQRIIDFVLNSNGEFSWTSPVNVYIALFTTTPSDAGGGVEVTGVNYARVDSGAWDTMTGILDGHTSNATLISFPQAGAGGWGLITSIGLFDALTGGNLLYYGDLGASRQIDLDDIFNIAIGDFNFTLQ